MPHSADAILDPSNPVSPLSVPATQTALLLLDYHNFIFSRVPAEYGPPVIAAVKALRAWAEANNALLIHGHLDFAGPALSTFKGFERITGMQKVLNSSPDAAASFAEPVGIAPKVAIETTGTEVQKVGENEYALKRQLGKLSALKSHGMMELLAEKGIRSLVIGGLSTSGCVAATARPAADEGFVVTVIEDACADPKEGVHGLVLEEVLSSQAHVCTAAEFVKAWDEKAGK